MINLFELAETQLQNEGRELSKALVLAYAVKIRRWLDKHRGTGEKILAGNKVYQYGNKFIFSNK